MKLDEKFPKEVMRYVSGEYTLADEKFVHDWLAEDPVRKEMLEELQTLWELSGGVLDLGDEQSAWKRVRQRVKEENKAADKKRLPFHEKGNSTSRGTLNMILRVAAVLLVVAGAVGFYLYTIEATAPPVQPVEEVGYNTITSKAGERVLVNVSDGTKVVLNESSQIRYRDDYGHSSRDIYLQGEAYFEVNHDHPTPFLVHARGAVIEDIGTKFNVNTRREDQGTEVVVSEGKVRVSPEKPAAENDSTVDKSLTSVVVSEGQKASVKNNPDDLTVEKADLHRSLAWLQDRLIFDDEPLSQVISQLENHYGITVEVADSSLFNKYVTGSFQDESVENVAKVLAISMQAGYSLEDSTLQFFIKRQQFNHQNN
ncbi:MAG: FecR domain-containing protein [Balneolaceae bacterium]|nr:FecR domain-containing protein [Balneolaceae bacterium]